jgi:flagellar hook-basal body protein
MGWSTIPDANTPGGHAVDRGLLRPLAIGPEKRNMPSEPTTLINIEGNLRTTQLSYNSATGEHYRIIPKTIYDSLGNAYVINMRFVFHDGVVSSAADSPHTYWTMEVVTGEFDPETGLPPAPGAEAPADGWPRGVIAYLEGDRRRPAFIGICLFNGKEFEGGSPDDFREAMLTSATIAFDSAGNLVGMGRTTEDGAPIPFYHSTREDQWNAGDDEAWRRGQIFNFSIMPLAGVTPSATFGSTPLSHPVSDYSPGPPPAAMPPEDSVRIAIGTLTMNFQALGQRGQENTTIRALTQDGGGPGSLTDISVGPDGTITGRFSNGRDRILGQIPLAFFSNPAGLERIGNSFWRESANSGPFDGVGLIGAMIGGALEGSNVDLANEFTEMITTQRGFQAASRTITVSDEMLQELVNLRR